MFYVKIIILESCAKFSSIKQQK